MGERALLASKGILVGASMGLSAVQLAKAVRAIALKRMCLNIRKGLRWKGITEKRGETLWAKA